MGDNTEGGASPHLGFAISIYMERLRRKIVFGEFGDLFGEPSWDILLCAFIASERRAPLSISDVARSTGMRLSTAQRHAELLAARGLLRKARDRWDSRRTILSLSPDGADKMRTFLERNEIPMLAYPMH